MKGSILYLNKKNKKSSPPHSRRDKSAKNSPSTSTFIAPLRLTPFSHFLSLPWIQRQPRASNNCSTQPLLLRTSEKSRHRTSKNKTNQTAQAFESHHQLYAGAWNHENYHFRNYRYVQKTRVTKHTIPNKTRQPLPWKETDQKARGSHRIGNRGAAGGVKKRRAADKRAPYQRIQRHNHSASTNPQDSTT
jgi:hypothetical protein